ncbi:MAG: bifunctional diaminohydroxyphosphoribosylaminopyrimidine deaminase/5-amino-6-(5-phosphoribosylamino)uracil reductase RibD [Candidatus Firestonebacteria bacterium]|nr:bifunctional diaminohydroxyphosphoribosylaminopyrimidine deaminase/5-amino-6-(5-phosphoribosylamino)uracil reductase RibD [Candidatus Firestonebacteria bacterium]
MKTDKLDMLYMQRAITLALKAEGLTKTNPIVGCVVVKNNRIVGEGYHKIFGGAHAEVMALDKAGSSAKGATIYVTLEPCFPYSGKKTPPCVEKVINAGVKRCVIAMQDPNPKVAGRSIALLKKNGIKVQLGLMKQAAECINEPFIKLIRTGLPLVISKMAITLDGKAAAYTGDSKWISNEQSRTVVHYKRSKLDAIMVGVGTVKQDNPELNVRMVKGRNPLKVIIDPNCEIPLKAKVLKDGKNLLLIVNTGANKQRVNKLLKRNIRVISVAGKEGTVNLKSTLSLLPVFGISSVMLEGGPTLLTAALKEKVVDRIMWFISPKILGGDGKSVVGTMGFNSIKNAIKIKEPTFCGLDGDILIEGRLN